MAASSPVLSNSSTDNTFSLTSSGSLRRLDATPKTLRGLNKPRCIQCGNVARSRCPYQSRKNCCAKAENPCHIHVLKSNATFQDTTPTSGSLVFDQQSNEASSSGTSSLRAIRQLSNNFAQFNYVQSPLRSRKPLTRKDAAALNEWRFSKLKEYKDRNIEVENEAFERYMQNINLLEEVFPAKTSLEKSLMDDSTNVNPTCKEENFGTIISEMRVKQRSSPTIVDNSRKRIRQIVVHRLKELKKFKLSDGGAGVDDHNENCKTEEWWCVEKASTLTDLTDKLNKARNEEDLKSCLELKSQLFDRRTNSKQIESEDLQISKEETANNELPSGKDLDYSMPKLFGTTEIDLQTLNSIDTHFSSLEQIEDL